MRRFEARWDGALRATTALSCTLVVAAPAWAAYVVLRQGGPAPVAWLALLVPGLALPLAAALAPRAYVVEPRRLVVERALSPIVLPLADIRRAGLLPDGALRGTVRAMGVSGMFGYVGRFRSRALGPFRMYATRRSGLVLVETARARFVLTPEHPERFVDALLAAAPGAERLADGAAPLAPAPTLPVPRGPPGMPVPPVPPRRGGARWRALLPMSLVFLPGLVAVATVGAVIARAPRSITATPERILVERRVGPATVLPVVGLARVERLPPGVRRAMRRTSGTAIGEVATGRFHSPTLGSFEMFAYRAGPYVLVQLASGTYVLTPDDPEAFVAALERRLPARRPRRSPARDRRSGAPRSRAAPRPR